MLKILILHVTYPTRASYLQDWLEAFYEEPKLDIININVYKSISCELIKKYINEVDLTILMHSCTADSLVYVNKLIPILQSRKTKLAAFIGNELNMPHIRILDRINFVKKIGADFILTQLLEEAGKWLYKETSSTVVEAPHGLNYQRFCPTVPHRKRRITFGVRSYRYPIYLGDNDRNRIIEYTSTLGCNNDVSFTKRLDPSEWANFLNHCTATPTTEAGGWYLQRDDKLVQDIYNYIKSNSKKIIINRGNISTALLNGLPFKVKYILKSILNYLPFYDQAQVGDDVDFEEIYSKFFINQKKCPKYSKCISSRHFEAIGTKTVQVSFPGRFNDILIADKHYLALEENYKNIQEIILKLQDPDFCEKLSQDTLEYILDSHTYSHRVSNILEKLK